jgi:hypothetical protein
VSLNNTLSISLYYSTCEVFKSHGKSSQVDFQLNSSSLLLLACYHSLLQLTATYKIKSSTLQLLNCLERRLTTDCKWPWLSPINPRHGPRSENTAPILSRHRIEISFLHCCVKSMHRRQFPPSLRGVFTGLLPSSGLHNPVVLHVYYCVLDRVYRTTAWQCVIQTRYIIYIYIYIYIIFMQSGATYMWFQHTEKRITKYA